MYILLCWFLFFIPGQSILRFVVNKLVMGQVFLRVFGFSVSVWVFLRVFDFLSVSGNGTSLPPSI
jgi:hypothetical protein